MEPQPNPRRAILLLIGAVLLAFFLPWLWHYYHTGSISITTNSPYNAITITKTSGSDNQSKTKNFKGRGKLSVETSSGEYTISVEGNSVGTVQTIKLKPHQKLHYAINPINATGVEPVAYKNALSLVVNNDQLIYLNGSSNLLYSIDRQNNLTKINSEKPLRIVKWADPSFGIGQDSGGHLYTVVNGSVNLLGVPFSYGDRSVNFDVSSNKKIYVSYGKDIYVGGQNGNFKKIYTADSPSPTLAAGPNQVAVADTKYGAKASNISKSLLATISTDTKESKKSIEAEQLKWSPNGQYLATYNQANPIIYDAALRTIATVPTSGVVGQFTWLNNNTLLYSVSGQLWTYNLSEQKAQLLANMPSNSSVTGLYLNSDKSYIYATTTGNGSDGSGYAIRRIGLKGQRVPDYIYNLQDVLPENLGRYVIGLINFSSPPTVFIQPYPNAPSSNYTQQAQAQLQSQGFNVNQLRFQLGRPVFSD